MNQLGEFVYQEPHHDRLYCELLDILLKELTLNGRRNISDDVYNQLLTEVLYSTKITQLERGSDGKD